MCSKTADKPISSGTRLGLRSLAVQLTLVYTAAASVLLLTVSWCVYVWIERYLRQDDDRRLELKLEEIQAIIQRESTEIEADLRQAVGLEYVAQSLDPFLIRVKDIDGNIVTETPKMDYLLPHGVFAGIAPRQPQDCAYSMVGPTGHAFRARSLELTSPSGRRFMVHGAVDHEPEINLLRRYRRMLWIANAAGLMGSAMTGYWIARRGLRPLEVMGEAVLNISSSSLHRRLPVEEYPDEISRLALKLNTMLVGLEEAFARLSRYSADIAHELRTPLHSLRGEAEVALSRERSVEEYRETLGSCLEECQRLGSLIDSLLFVARVENPAMRIRREVVDLQTELNAILEYYEAPASEAGIVLEQNLTGPLLFPLDRQLFRRAVGNLLENSLKYCESGGRITISAAFRPPSLEVSVTDTGRGIPPENLPHVFDRFYRVDADRSKETGGHGLGLAIVKTIASLHRGEVMAASELGKGTTITITFGPTEPTEGG